MRTTIDIDEQLLEKAMAISKEKKKGKTINRALAEFVRQERLDELLSARGTFDLVDNLDELEQLEIEEMKKLE